MLPATRYELQASNGRLFLEALLAAVPLTILGPTSFSFMPSLVDFIFVLKRKPVPIQSYCWPTSTNGSIQTRYTGFTVVSWDCRLLFLCLSTQ